MTRASIPYPCSFSEGMSFPDPASLPSGVCSRVHLIDASLRARRAAAEGKLPVS